MRNWPKYVQAAREGARLSRAELAAAINVSYPTVWRWETGKQTPENSDVVVKFAEVTGVDVNEALVAAGLRPAEQPPSEPAYQKPPLDPVLQELNDRLTDPALSEEERVGLRTVLRYITTYAPPPSEDNREAG